MTTAFDDYEHAPLGDRQYPYPSRIGGAYAYVYTLYTDPLGPICVLGGVGLTPGQARGLADALHRAADDIEQASVLP